MTYNVNNCKHDVSTLTINTIIIIILCFIM